MKMTIELPLPLLEFLRDHGQDHREYAERSVVHAVGVDIDDLDVFGFKDGEDAKKAIKQYGLGEILKRTVAKEFC